MRIDKFTLRFLPAQMFAHGILKITLQGVGNVMRNTYLCIKQEALQPSRTRTIASDLRCLCTHTMYRILLNISAFCILSALLLTGCTHPSKTQQQPGRFTTDVRLRTTPVKNQGQNDLCWLYAMLATIETEHLMRGDSVHLSMAYPTKCLLEELTRERYLSRGCAPLSTRGTPWQALHLLMAYGAMPYDSYPTDEHASIPALVRKLQRLTDIDIARRTGLPAHEKSIARMIEDNIGPAPIHVFMFGAEYTTTEFAHSVCRKDEYQAYTSFTHHPFGTRFVLEIPDNRRRNNFLNVPIKTLVKLTETALRHGHPVCWEGDVSEPGFSQTKGLAEMPHGTSCTQQERQRQFERFDTTDDHCMTLIGMAHDAHGQRFFICKNSWGTNNPYGGFIYMSLPYFYLKTIAIYLSNGL